MTRNVLYMGRPFVLVTRTCLLCRKNVCKTNNFYLFVKSYLSPGVNYLFLFVQGNYESNDSIVCTLCAVKLNQ